MSDISLQNKAIVWSQSNCSYCMLAKQLLMGHRYMIEERKIGEGWTKKQLLDVVPDARSVPQIFINGTYIGGYTDLKAYLNANT